MDRLLGTNMKSKKHGKKTKKGIKVVYISSPMKVKTSASEFRALVQELTGKDSDTARYMDDVNGADHNSSDDQRFELQRGQMDYHSPSSFVPMMMNNYNDQSQSSPSSDSVFDDFFPGIEGSFTGLLQSSFCHESSQIDVFN